LSSAFAIAAVVGDGKTEVPPGRVVMAPVSRKQVGGWCEQRVKQQAMGYSDVACVSRRRSLQFREEDVIGDLGRRAARMRGVQPRCARSNLRM
jgi:hypothetical protein